ncbi:DUF1961 family protein [Pedobacter heparinus]|uniref:DUF1961 family protein n=1 Tax=Pedobacter heparinus (strain ATCC 13125 / DSM 2366 / CIP 104194 / JCM 7457 / NBRC 12017 / NCIMB 9290 / NRRL B-14731 / HIM 762-3) TaxID=485917 RepID=C6Y1P1_PEDHD|nr:DUF1961 family protein [Pedobacter heparinus]ACU05033.1 hypothetical protein Phep_2834 [Pedobacter heparinus DSM 2366]
MSKVFIAVSLILLSHLGFTQSANKKILICSYEFNNNKELKDWKIEGEGRAFIRNGKLILEPSHFQMLKKLMDEGKISKKNEVAEYQPYVIAAMKKKYGKDISRYYVNGKADSAMKDAQFLGGSFNFWNTRFPTGTDFSIAFDFKCLYPTPLHMIMFSAMGTNGKGIFDKTFPERYGLSSEIMTGQLNNYRLSFFEPERKTANLRKAPGRKLLYEAEDVVSKDPYKTYHCEIKKIAGTISYLVDGKVIFAYTDSQPLGAGYWGFRLMPCALGEYDHIKVYKILNP